MRIPKKGTRYSSMTRGQLRALAERGYARGASASLRRRAERAAEELENREMGYQTYAARHMRENPEWVLSEPPGPDGQDWIVESDDTQTLLWSPYFDEAPVAVLGEGQLGRKNAIEGLLWDARSTLRDWESTYRSLARIPGRLTRDERREKARAADAITEYRNIVRVLEKELKR